MRSLIATVLAGLILAGAAGQAGAADLTRTQVLAFAIETLDGGEPAKALALAEAVISVFPDDATAHILRARALGDLGRMQAAAAAARKGFALSDADNEKYNAAMLLSQSLAADGQRTLAQFWLRRAHDLADTEPQARAAATLFRNVRADNPWSFQFSFSAAPNDNLRNDLTGYSIPGLTQVLYSGVTTTTVATASYRFSRTANSQSSIGLLAQGIVHFMDDESQAQASAAGDGPHDFDYVSLAATFRHLQTTGPGAIVINGSAGHSWYGWQSYAFTASLDAEYRIPLVERQDLLTLFGKGRATVFTEDGEAPALALEGGARYRHKLATGDTLEVTAALLATLSATASRHFYGGRLAVDYDFGAPVLTTEVGLGAYVELRDYPDYFWGGENRRDTRYGAKLEIGLPELAIMGFTPVVTTKVDKVMSTADPFDAFRTTIGVGLRSQF